MATGHPIKFGTDGWRAVIGEDFTFEIQYDLTYSRQYRLFFAYQLVPVVAVNTE